MKKNFLIFLIILLAITIPITSSAAEYFVATNGNDSDSGTQDSPWRTIQKAADTVSAGDTVYIRSGTYSEGTIYIKSSGKDDNTRITFTNFGNENVIIEATFSLGNYDWLTFRGLTIQNCNNGFYEAQSRGMAGSDYITVENCIIQNTTSYGIYIARGKYVTVRNCIIKNTGNSCINTYGSNWLIQDNDISNPAVEDGIHFSGGGHTISRNYVHDINAPAPSHTDGIQVSCGHDSIVEYNIIENSRSSAIMQDCVDDSQPDRCDGMIYRYNLIYVTQEFSQYTNAGIRMMLYHSVGMKIYNNIFAFNGTPNVQAIRVQDKTPSHPSTVEVYNNTFYYMTGINGYTGASSLSIDNNIYYGNSDQNPKTQNDTGANSVRADPNFEFNNNTMRPGPSFGAILAAKWLKPKSGSPAINAGRNIAEKSGWRGVDIANNSVPIGTWDIGAYEFGSSGVPRPPVDLRVIP